MVVHMAVEGVCLELALIHEAVRHLCPHLPLIAFGGRLESV